MFFDKKYFTNIAFNLSELTEPVTYNIDFSHIEDRFLDRLFDHGFLISHAPIINKDLFLDTHEFVLISRSYVKRDEIIENNKGVSSYLIADEEELFEDPGKIVATVITGPGEYADELLSCIADIPAQVLPYVMSKSMLNNYIVTLESQESDYIKTKAKILKK